MWSLMVMSRRAPNTPPRITTSQLYASEDKDDIHDSNGQNVIHYEDDESDSVEFTILQQPVHGFANITPDGTIPYLSDENFNGVDFIIVKIVETGLLPPFHPFSSSNNITIQVELVNDAPVVLPFESGMEFEEIDDQGRWIKMVNFLIEGNITRKYDLGHVTFYDVDFVDPNMQEINYTMRINNTKLSNFSFELVNYQEQFQIKFKLSLSLDKSFYGRTSFTTGGFDRARFTTKNIEVNVYILIAPCVHGNCLNKTTTTCHDLERATSFEKYSCDCDVGYTGEWCQTDINECDPNPCTVFYDCENLIGYQKCNLNVAKTVLLTLAVMLMLVMCFVLIRRYYKKRKPNKVDPGSDIWSFGSGYLIQSKSRFIRPSTACSTEDLIPPHTIRHINVSIGSSMKENLDNPSQSGKSMEEPQIRLFSEKTMDELTKTLEPLSALTTLIGQTAPHHQQLKLKLNGQDIDLNPQKTSLGPNYETNEGKTKKLKPLKVPGYMRAPQRNPMDGGSLIISKGLHLSPIKSKNKKGDFERNQDVGPDHDQLKDDDALM